MFDFEPRAVLQQARFDIGTQLRNGEQQLLNLGLPAGGLWLLHLIGRPDLLPLLLASSVFASNFTGTAIAAAYERRQGALKALALSPVGRSGMVIARSLAGFSIGIAQFAALTLVATITGMNPNLGSLWSVPLIAFAANGWALTIASALRAEAVLALSNSMLLLLAGWATAAPSWSQLLNPIGFFAQRWPTSEFAGSGLLIGVLQLAVPIVLAARTFTWE